MLYCVGINALEHDKYPVLQHVMIHDKERLRRNHQHKVKDLMKTNRKDITERISYKFCKVLYHNNYNTCMMAKSIITHKITSNCLIR